PVARSPTPPATGGAPPSTARTTPRSARHARDSHHSVRHLPHQTAHGQTATERAYQRGQATAPQAGGPLPREQGPPRSPFSGILTEAPTYLALLGVSTDSARGSETTGNNRHQPDNPDMRMGRLTRQPRRPVDSRSNPRNRSSAPPES